MNERTTGNDEKRKKKENKKTLTKIPILNSEVWHMKETIVCELRDNKHAYTVGSRRHCCPFKIKNFRAKCTVVRLSTRSQLCLCSDRNVFHVRSITRLLRTNGTRAKERFATHFIYLMLWRVACDTTIYDSPNIVTTFGRWAIKTI